jgi:protein-disulfide isomerase
VFGNVNAKVTLIEYGDYQCPACHKIYPTVKALTEENKDSLRFVFRNFPISDLHPNARAAAASAEAASIEGKFWEMHNGLYEQYDSWANASADKRTEALASIATSVGLDKTKFLALLEDRSSDINKKINDEFQEIEKVGKEKKTKESEIKKAQEEFWKKQQQ